MIIKLFFRVFIYAISLYLFIFILIGVVMITGGFIAGIGAGIWELITK